MKLFHGTHGSPEQTVHVGTCLTPDYDAAVGYAQSTGWSWSDRPQVWTVELDTTELTVVRVDDVDAADLDVRDDVDRIRQLTGLDDTVDVLVTDDGVIGIADCETTCYRLLTPAAVAAATVTQTDLVTGYVATDYDGTHHGQAETETAAEQLLPTDDDGDADGYVLDAATYYTEQHN